MTTETLPRRRARKGETKRSEVLTVRLAPNTRDSLDSLAAAVGTSRAVVVELALAQLEQLLAEEAFHEELDRRTLEAVGESDFMREVLRRMKEARLTGEPYRSLASEWSPVRPAEEPTGSQT